MKLTKIWWYGSPKEDDLQAQKKSLVAHVWTLIFSKSGNVSKRTRFVWKLGSLFHLLVKQCVSPWNYYSIIIAVWRVYTVFRHVKAVAFVNNPRMESAKGEVCLSGEGAHKPLGGHRWWAAGKSPNNSWMSIAGKAQTKSDRFFFATTFDYLDMLLMNFHEIWNNLGNFLCYFSFVISGNWEYKQGPKPWLSASLGLWGSVEMARLECFSMTGGQAHHWTNRLVPKKHM